MAYNNVFRQLHGEIMGETEKAIKFSLFNGDRQVVEWLPLSQLQSIHRLFNEEKEQLDILMVSEWILKQKNWLDLAGTTAKPQLSGVPTTTVPKIQDKLQHPPVSNWLDMDDDIPF